MERDQIFRRLRLSANLALAASANRAGNSRFVVGLVFFQQHSIDKGLECMAAFLAEGFHFRAIDLFVFHRTSSARNADDIRLQAGCPSDEMPLF